MKSLILLVTVLFSNIVIAESLDSASDIGSSDAYRKLQLDYMPSDTPRASYHSMRQAEMRSVGLPDLGSTGLGSSGGAHQKGKGSGNGKGKQHKYSSQNTNRYGESYNHENTQQFGSGSGRYGSGGQGRGMH